MNYCRKKRQAEPAKTIQEVESYALYYLNKYGETSEQNLRTRLLRNKTDNQEWVDEIILKVIEYGYLSDMRYAEIIVRHGVENKGWGRQRILSELIKKGIKRDVIDSAILVLDRDDPVSRAATLIEKKFKCEINKDNWRKAVNFLANRGFSFDTISSAIKTYNAEFFE